MTIRHWTGPHLSHPIWHWIWIVPTAQHGYGPTREAAERMARSAKSRSAPQFKIERRF